MKKVIEKEKEVTESSATSFLMSGLLDSNQRPRAPQTCALPTALNPEHFLLGTDHAGAKVHTFSESSKFSSNFLIFFLNLTPTRHQISNKMRNFAC